MYRPVSPWLFERFMPKMASAYAWKLVLSMLYPANEKAAFHLSIKCPVINKTDHSIWWLVNPANMLGLKLISQAKIDGRFIGYLQRPCRYQSLKFSTISENNHSGSNLAIMGTQVVPWGSA
jgi:hypothetical protein